MDGAAVNLGKNKVPIRRILFKYIKLLYNLYPQGIGKLFQDACGAHKFMIIHCSAHRAELVFKHAMENYPTFAKIEKMVNQLYTYYKSSGKRLGDLHDFAEHHNARLVALTYIYDVRWVTSHKDAMQRVVTNIPVFVPHMDLVVRNLDRSWKAGTVATARELRGFYTARNVVILIVFQTDVLEEFSRVSLLFQSDDQSSE